MKRCLALIPLWLTLLFALSCGKDLPEGEEGKTAADGKEIMIVFSLPGDDFATAEDLEMRKAVVAAIAAGGYGEVTRTESGMGSMGIGVRLRRVEDIGAVKKLLFDGYPQARYRIER